MDVTAVRWTEPARSRRPWVAAALVAAALTAATVPSSATAETSSGVARSGEISDRSVDRAEGYWTAKRMLQAEPADIELTSEPPVLQQGGEEPSLQAGPIPYTSFELPDTTSYPNRVHGKVFFTKPGVGNFVCSGTVVNGVNDSTVVTAGHCLNDNGVWSTNFAFVPGYRDGQAPFGVWAASNLYATQPWVLAENLRYDFGSAVVARNSAGEELEDVVGARGIAFSQPVQQSYRSHGHPAGSPFNGSKLWACESDFGFHDYPLPNQGPATLAIGCNMTGGSSGGGWVINGQDVVSLNSYKYTSQTEVMYGPYFGTTAQAVFNLAQGAAPGASPATVTPPANAQPAPLLTAQPSCKKPKRKRGGKPKSKRGGTKKNKKKKKKAKKLCAAKR
jgi:V8-like Glu-specific endopeptidase